VCLLILEESECSNQSVLREAKVYLIIVYDINVKRVVKVLKFLRRYLNWVQNSVFEGELTYAEFKKVQAGLKKIINEDEDSVAIYRFDSSVKLIKETMGVEKSSEDNVL
jgi:CRISPR-associated protein Cas2